MQHIFMVRSHLLLEDAPIAIATGIAQPPPTDTWHAVSTMAR